MVARFLADQRDRLEPLVGAFEPRRSVHRIAERGVAQPALAAEIADHRFAMMKPRAGAAELGAVVDMVDREFLGEADHRDQGGGGALAIVGPRDRGTPEGDDGVADELVDRPAMIEHDVAHPVEIGVEQRRDAFRRQAVAQGGEALDVGEQCVELALFAGQAELGRIAQNLCGDVAGEVFAERRLGIAALVGPDRAHRRPGRGIGEHPPAEPAERGQAISVDAVPLEIEGGEAEKQ